MPKVSMQGYIPHKLRRDLSVCFGMLALLFQMAMPLAGAVAAELSGASPAEVICAPSGRLISIDADQNNHQTPTMACEFCMVCQFAVNGHLSTRGSTDLDLNLRQTRIFWIGVTHRDATNDSEFAAPPVRAPPSFI